MSENKEPHRSFTVRVPVSLYAEIGDAAVADGVRVNTKVNQLIRLGMDKHISLDAALAKLLKAQVTADE